MLWAGRLYMIGLFFYGTYLLGRQRLWTLHLVFILGASGYVAYTILAALGQTPSATPHRLLALYGGAVCIHVLLVLLHVLVKQGSLQALRPLRDG